MSWIVARPILIRLGDDVLGALQAVGEPASSTSTIAVGMPDRACAVAMPDPIRPAPSTPTRWTGRGVIEGRRRPGRATAGSS